jgi:hypothetical protein
MTLLFQGRSNIGGRFSKIVNTTGLRGDWLGEHWYTTDLDKQLAECPWPASV